MANGLALGGLQGDIAIRIGHAGQYAALGLFFRSESGPLYLVMHGALFDLPQTGAAGAIAAGAGPLQTSHFHGVQQRICGPCIALFTLGCDVEGVQGWGICGGDGAPCRQSGRPPLWLYPMQV